jgi:hypothetical protein
MATQQELLQRRKELLLKKRDLLTQQPEERPIPGIITGGIPLRRGFGTGALRAPVEAIPQETQEKLIKGGELLRSEVLSPIASGVSTAAFGLPKALMTEEERQRQFPEQKTLPGKALRVGSEVLGLVKGGGAKFAGKAASKIAGKTLAKTALKSVVGGGTFGLTQLAEDPTLIGQLAQAGGGAVLGGIFGLGTGALNKLRNVKGDKAAGFAENLRKKFFKIKTDAVSKFGKQLDNLAEQNPTNQVSLSGLVDDIASNIDDFSPQAKTAIKKNPKLNALLNNPENASNVSVRDVQDMINHMNTKVPANIKATHLEILDTVNDLRAAQLDAFPQMSQVRADYASTIRPFNEVKNKFKFNRLIKAVENDFGGEEGAKAVKQLFPPDVIDDIGGFKAARSFAEGSKQNISNLIKFGVGYEILRSQVLRPLNRSIREIGIGGGSSSGGDF